MKQLFDETEVRDIREEQAKAARKFWACDPETVYAHYDFLREFGFDWPDETQIPLNRTREEYGVQASHCQIRCALVDLEKAEPLEWNIKIELPNGFCLTLYVPVEYFHDSCSISPPLPCPACGQFL